jgi:aspartate/methionine/tyrosine aminotransferase
MERWQSTWENRVAHNLSESGVHPLTAADLLALADEPPPLDLRLSYGQSNGSDELRSRIADLYPDSSADNVVVTAGGAEANFAAAWELLRPGDDVVVITPTYMQVYGLAEAFGARVREVHLRESLGWQPDPDDIRRAVTPGTRAIVLTNPNNPTGAVLQPQQRRAIIDAAAATGAWIKADDVYIWSLFDIVQPNIGHSAAASDNNFMPVHYITSYFFQKRAHRFWQPAFKHLDGRLFRGNACQSIKPHDHHIHITLNCPE